MQVALWYWEVMLVFLVSLWVEERWKMFSWIADKSWDGMLAVWCRMMAHTGDPIYQYKGRRFK